MRVKPRRAIFFQEDDGTKPLEEWLASLMKRNRGVYKKILLRIRRSEGGNFGDHKFLGNDWGEIRITSRPGYRIYFGIDDDERIILLRGGTKQRQSKDIELAKVQWTRFLRNKEARKN